MTLDLSLTLELPRILPSFDSRPEAFLITGTPAVSLVRAFCGRMMSGRQLNTAMVS